MNKITALFVIGCLGALIALQWQQNADIHAIRQALEPKALTFGAEPPPFRARIDFCEDSHQEPEVTLL